MVTEDYVTVEIARLLKDKGFDGKCRCIYHPDDSFEMYDNFLSNRVSDVKSVESDEDDSFVFVTAPTVQMAVKWLRENHKLHIEVEVYYCEDGQMWLAKIQRIGDGCTTLIKTCMCNETYETAVDNGLKYCLENLI